MDDQNSSHRRSRRSSFGREITNIEINPSTLNGLTKKSIADCLQTRPIDRRFRLRQIRGELESEIMLKIDEALKIVFAL